MARREAFAIGAFALDEAGAVHLLPRCVDTFVFYFLFSFPPPPLPFPLLFPTKQT